MAESRFCQNCGNKVVSGVRFCSNCGADLGVQSGVGSDNANNGNFVNNNFNPYSQPTNYGEPFVYNETVNTPLEKANDWATLALVFSILGIWFLPLTITGTVFNVKARKARSTKTGFLIAATILNVIGYIFALMWAIAISFFIALMVNGPYY